MDFVYELRDSTDDERYFLLGIFESVAAVKKVVADFDSNGDAVTEYGANGDIDYEILTIHKLAFGTVLNDGHGVCVMTINRKSIYDEDADEYRWGVEQ